MRRYSYLLMLYSAHTFGTCPTGVVVSVQITKK